MTTENHITDDVLAAFEEAGHEYLDADDLTLTADTLEDLRVASKTWSECGEITEETYNGYAALEFDGVQVAKGQARHALTVIDLGAVRAVYK